MMNRVLRKNLIALATLSALSAPALAANSADLSVVGTIAPGSCDITLGAGGRIDYGTILHSSLDATGYTLLPRKGTSIAINCTAPTAVALRTLTQRPNTAATEGADSTDGSSGTPSSVILFGNGGIRGWGLGLAGTSRIGGFAIRVVPATVQLDGAAVDALDSNDGGANWAKSNSGVVGNNRIATWGATGTTTPLPFTTMTGTLEIEGYLNKQANLDLTAPIRLDGLNTIELYYL